ncbi:MAG: hypothetical protein EOP06_24900 [Proteobacteria bacterium]|nr:MAG: hypothetical protein EOP06_24900 [Pseudomonadota bacterium]
MTIALMVDTFVDTPLLDARPLSSWHTKYKGEIIEAKDLALQMGVKLPPIYVVEYQEDGSIAGCWMTGFGNRISLVRPRIEKMLSESFDRRTRVLDLLDVFVHEWGHCGLGLGHDESGVMAPAMDVKTDSPVDAYYSWERFNEMNSSHGANLNLQVFLNYLERYHSEVCLDLPRQKASGYKTFLEKICARSYQSAH